MGLRNYKLITGVTTSNIPTATNPTDPSDNISKGYADQTYTPKQAIGGNVDTIADLKDLITQTGAPLDRVDNQQYVVSDLNITYKYDSSSLATSDDDTVVRPDDVANDGLPGRWLKSLGASTGGSGGGGGIDLAAQKMELEFSGLISEETENDLLQSGAIIPSNKFYYANLIESPNATETEIVPVWNAEPEDAADPNMDSSALYSANGSAATNIGTSATSPKIGTNWISFDKTTGSVNAELMITLPTAKFIKNPMRFLFIKMPNLTQFSKFKMRIYAGTTSDYAEWDVTTQYPTGAIIALGKGNLIGVDLRTTPTATGGTGWDLSKESKYRSTFVVTTASGQTYSGILVDAVCHSLDPEEFGLIGTEQSLNDDSTVEDIIIDSSNSKAIGRVALASGLANSYTAGLSGASIAKIQRSTMICDGEGIYFEDGLSGDVDLSQEIRISRIFNESKSGNFIALIDGQTRQAYKVKTVGGSSIDVESPSNDSADMLTGKIDVFTPYESGNKEFYRYKTTKTFTSSSWSSGVLTIDCTPGTISAKDIVVKRFFDIKTSSVALGSNESFTTKAIVESASGLKLLNRGMPYLWPDKLWASYSLGAQTNILAIRNRAPNTPGPTLTVGGTPNFQTSFLNGYYGVSNISASNYLMIPGALSAPISGNSATGTVTYSIWFNDKTGFTGGERIIISKITPSFGVYGFAVYLLGGSNVVRLFGGNLGALADVPYVVGEDNHIIVHLQQNNHVFIVNGVKYTSAAGDITLDTDNFYVGKDSTGAYYAAGVEMSHLDIWRNAPIPTVKDADYLRRNGNFQPQGFAPCIRSVVPVNGLSGDKYSMKVRTFRDTDSVNSRIRKMGLVKV